MRDVDDPVVVTLLQKWLASGRCQTPQELCANDPAMKQRLEREIDLYLAEEVFPITADLSAASQRADNSPAASGTPQIEGFCDFQLLDESENGRVYRAIQIEFNRPVAIKLLAPQASSGGGQRLHRFKREIKLLSRFTHSTIAQVYGSGFIESPAGIVPWFSMEYVQGLPLDQHVHEHNLSLGQVLGLMIQVIRAVHFMHEQAVIHRDLKPANILVSQQGPNETDAVPKVLDFGIAKLMELDPDDQARTLTGHVFGTFRYMSPEQFTGGGESVGPQTDVYQLGVILYELLSGRVPVEVPTSCSPAEASRRICGVEPPRLRSVQPRVPRDVELIVHKAMSKDVKRRYTTAEELAQDIERFIARKPVHAHADGVVYSLSRWAARNNPAVVVMAILLCASIISTIFYIRSESERRRADGNAGQLAKQLVDLSLKTGFQAITENDPTIGLLSFVRVMELRPPSSVSTDADRIRFEMALRQAAQPISVAVHDQADSEVAAATSRIEILNDPDRFHYQIKIVRPSFASPAVIEHQSTERGCVVNWAETDRQDRLLVVASKDYSAHVYDLQTCEPVCSPLQHDKEVQIARFSPDSDYVATGGWDGNLRLWQLPSGRNLWSVDCDQFVLDVAFSPDGKTLAAGCYQGGVKVFDVLTGKRVAELPGQKLPVSHVEFRSDGTELLSCCDDGTVRRWKTSDWTLISPIIRHPRPVISASYAQNSDSITAVMADYGIHGAWFEKEAIVEGQLVVPEQPRTIIQWRLPPNATQDLDSPSGRHIKTLQLSRETPTMIVVEDTGMLRHLALPSLEDREPPVQLPYRFAEKKWLATLGEHTLIMRDVNGSIHCLHFNDGNVTESEFPYPDETSVALNADESLACVSFTSGFAVWDIARKSERYRVQTGLASRCSFDPQGRVLFLGMDGTATWYDAHSGSKLADCRPHDQRIVSADFHVPTDRVVTHGYDKSAAIFTVGAKQPALRLHETSPVYEALWDPDGNRVVTTSEEGRIQIWDALTGRPLVPSITQPDRSSVAIFSPDGKLVLSSTSQGAYLWDAWTGQLVAFYPAVAALPHRSLLFLDAHTVVLTGTSRIGILEIPSAGESVERSRRRAEFLAGCAADHNGINMPLALTDWQSRWNSMIKMQ